ncbi:MAG TPA: Na+/H+ antiporter NhaA [Ilumatobacter sp.]|nr:Na+/H+ antiporter NhaA [Ilumatobacter sp.]
MTSKLLASARPTFLQSDRRLARAMQPVVRFLHVEAAGGIVLLLATAAALIWANSAWQDSYESFWHTTIHIEIGSYTFDEDLAHVVNDALMALFFFVVGMEIKRELVVGELRDRRAVALPALAALGGMLVPALIYAAFNAGGPGADGWGIPMATDIAFALGVVALLGDRVPSAIKVLLLTLAIVDDIGAIAVIAIFYTDGLRPGMLLVAAGAAALVWAMHRVNVTSAALFVFAGIALWLAVYESGVHATIAGVVLGLVTPARPTQSELESDEIVDVLENQPELRAADVRETATLIRGSVSPCDRLIEALHPWTSYVVLPIFALANAGIPLSMDALRDPSDVMLGIILGLVVGKLVGIVLFSWLAVRVGIGRLPTGTRWRHMIGLAAVAGIGFTVSLFIAGLAFGPGAVQDEAKMGVLVASAVAAALGTLVFSTISRTEVPEADDQA